MGRASCLQNVAPMVLGMISDSTSTAKVSAAAKMPTARPPPKTRSASAPLTVAPTVWAMVFRVRIAAIGSSICRFIRARMSPALSPRP